MSGYKLCRHLMPNGRTCQSPAMRGSAYCYFHDPEKSPRRTARTADTQLELVPVDDPSSIQCNGDRILRAAAANQISTRKAAVLLQGLQTIMASWKIPPVDDFDPASDSPVPELDALASLCPASLRPALAAFRPQPRDEDASSSSANAIDSGVEYGPNQPPGT